MSWIRRRVRVERPLVVESQQGAVRVEGVDHLASADPIDRVAIVAHWDEDGRVDRSTATLVAALIDHRYEVVLVSTAPDSGRLQGLDDATRITTLRRPNVGYDFGSWATALARYPGIAAAEHVLLLNTSMAGPFAPIDHLIRQFEESPADVWSMTDSTQFHAHPQSYCLGFRRRCLEERPMVRFWREIRVEASRDAVIRRYELGLGRLLEEERYVVDVAIRSWKVVADGQNPTIVGWRRLLDLGFPFVKRQVLREPAVAPDGLMAPAELLTRFGVAVDEWL
jgi:lipopolysaccharide biosynthesis protein